MGYTIKNFIDSNKFPGMKLISDNSGINREIRGVRIIVDPNMENFLGGWVAPNFFVRLWKTRWSHDGKSLKWIK